MPTANDTIAHSLTVSAGLLHRYVADLTPEEYLHRPADNANCTAWLIGHLILTDRRALVTLGVTDLPPLPAGDFEKRFSRDEGCPQASDFGDIADLMPLFDKHRSLWRAENVNSPIDSLAARAVQGVMGGGGGQRNPGFIEEIIPKLVSPDGLHDRMWLKHVHVHPADEHGAVTIAFQFVCTSIGEGFAVHWRDGKVEKVGPWKTAEPAATTKGAAS